MKTKLIFLLLTLFGYLSINAQKTKLEVIKAIDSKYDQYSAIANKIWEYAEVGFQETQSSALLQETLSKAGFKIESGVAGMPTAFIAT